MINRCNSCERNCLYNSRNSCEKFRIGTLEYLRNGASGCVNCNLCSNACEKSYAQADMPCLTGCSGERIFYTGPCGGTQRICGCCGNNNCCSHNGCSGCNHCSGCNSGSICEGCGCADCGGCLCGNATPYAAGFTAVVPQHCSAGGALTFISDGDCGGFGVEHCGIRIHESGRYMALYTFSSSACDNAASTLCLELNGRALCSSRSYLSPAVQTSSRSAVGQAVFCAQAGDIITLNTSVALTISQTYHDCPCSTMVILKIN